MQLIRGVRQTEQDRSLTLKVLAPSESGPWLKRRNARHPEREPGKHYEVAYPEDRATEDLLAERLAGLTDWTGGGVVLERPGLPREDALDEVCNLRREYDYPTSRDDLQLGVSPGHLLDGEQPENARNLRRLAGAMLRGHLEGTIASKGGRLVVVVECAVVHFYAREKSLAGKIRELIKELRLQPLGAAEQ